MLLERFDPFLAEFDRLTQRSFGTSDGVGLPMDVVRRGERGPRLVTGLALAVEPMVTLGSQETDVLEDDWTVVTTDGSPAAHFEHTFTLTPEGAWVLTALDGGQERLSALGVPFGGRPDPR